ncbi:MAG: restriction endonuclease subunit S [Syntrophaceticus schinkii]|jgi:type I restriction enzyme S subunit|nr:restriction endonuclease subunit S [Syntrophaceticus schinkii]MDD4674514.1 restriction endonuclease subunit S [Syntrophaceticus schinkii]
MHWKELKNNLNTEDLKNKILQLAVQGKLVEHDPNDEPASVLLKKIQKEKERLVKEKKIRKSKPLPPITEDEIPFELPNGWEWVRLKDVGYDFGQKKPDKKFTYIDVGSINQEKSVLGENNNILNPENAPSRARKIVANGTVIYSTVRPYLLNIAIIDQDFIYEPIVSTAFAIVHPYNGIFNKYIYYCLKSNFFIDYVQSQMVGMAYPAINESKFFNGLIPLPPTNEQKRIAEKVDELFAIIEKLDNNKDELLKTIENTRNMILQSAIQGKLVPQDPTDEPASILLGKIKEEKEKLIKEKKIRKSKPLPPITKDEIPFEIPEGWEWVKLGEIGDSIIGLTYKPSDITKNGVPVLRANNIKDGAINYENLVRVNIKIKNDLILKDGDLLICARSGSKHLVGKSALVKNTKEMFTFGAFMTVYKSNFNEFVYHFLNSNVFRFQLGESNTTTVNQLTQKMLRNILIPFPPFADQKRIVEKVDELMSLCDELEKYIVVSK